MMRVSCSEVVSMALQGFAATTASSLRGAPPTPTLRQYEVLVAQVNHGSENAAARALGLSPYTVRNQLASLRLYWGARSTTHLVALVYKHVGDIFVVAVGAGIVWWMA